jgi:hypothetical protein
VEVCNADEDGDAPVDFVYHRCRVEVVVVFDDDDEDFRSCYY